MKKLGAFVVTMALVAVVVLATRAENYYPPCHSLMDLEGDHCLDAQGNCCPN